MAMTAFSRAVFGVGLAVAASLIHSPGARAQTSGPVLPPTSFALQKYLQLHPDARAHFTAPLPQRAAEALIPTASRAVPAAGGVWTAVRKGASGLCNPLLLADGTVIVHACDSANWMKLSPDAAGNYAAGTWSPIASMPVINGVQYGPQYNASAVLPDGRAIVMGGEYNVDGSGFVNLGAIYDPVANTWTPVPAPAGSGWTSIGDAQSLVLANGTFLLGSCCASPDVDALLDAKTLTWTSTGAPAGGTYQDEQGYELLPTGTLLTVDEWTNDPAGNTSTELYNPATGAWGPTGKTPVQLGDPCGTFEIGPAVLRGDGTVVAFGGNTGCNGVTANPVAVYTTKTGVWAAAPDVPSVCGANSNVGCDLADAPAALMPNGKILFAASSGFGTPPSHFFELDHANVMTQVADPLLNASKSGSYYYNFLVLPNGQVLMTDFSAAAEVYTPVGAALATYQPSITKVPSVVTHGGTYKVTGKQLNGISQGAYYGDDAQAATNYPILRITNVASGHVVYARTSAVTTRSIKPGLSSSVKFTLPATTETGASNLAAIANGVASSPVSITVN